MKRTGRQTCKAGCGALVKQPSWSTEPCKGGPDQSTVYASLVEGGPVEILKHC